jgi:hypothetical protein
MWPQITILVMMFISLCVTIHKSGKEQNTKNLITYIISAIITLFLLYMGHFFDVLLK